MKPRVWTILLAYVSVWLFQLLVGAVLIAAGVRRAGDAQGAAPPEEALRESLETFTRLPEVTLFSALAVSLYLLALSFGAAGLSPVRVGERLSLAPPAWAPSRTLLGYLVSGVFMLALGVAATSLLQLVFGRPSEAMRSLQQSIQEASPGVFVALALSVGVLAPVAEELFFRGYLQTRFVRRFGAVAGIGLSAALFATLHADVLHMGFAFIAGLGLGWLVVRTGSVWPAVVGHVAVNLPSVLVARVVDAEPAGGAAASLIVVSLLVVAVAGALLHRWTGARSLEPRTA